MWLIWRCCQLIQRLHSIAASSFIQSARTQIRSETTRRFTWSFHFSLGPSVLFRRFAPRGQFSPKPSLRMLSECYPLRRLCLFSQLCTRLTASQTFLAASGQSANKATVAARRVTNVAATLKKIINLGLSNPRHLPHLSLLIKTPTVISSPRAPNLVQHLHQIGAAC